jgi:signal transduction histidine kinase
VIAISSREAPLPGHAEARLADFTELVAAEIARSRAQQNPGWLAEEQAALRQVATLVARGAPSAEVFDAVTGEVGRLVGADEAALRRYETDGTATTVSSWSRAGDSLAAGTRFPNDPGTVSWQILQTGRPGRIDNFAERPGACAAACRDLGWHSAVAAPVIVAGSTWGMAIVASKRAPSLPLDTEARVCEFTDLVATAIANAESRAELAASRARIVVTADATRRRIERDLHDGAQQRLVSVTLELRAAQAEVPPEYRAALSHAIEELTSAVNELREIARGIYPSILAHGGLGPALKTLAHRSAVPVKLDMQATARLPERVEVAAYYIISEALTNAAKHARASVVQVSVEARDRILCVGVDDDGQGGADLGLGSGLLGLKDRAEAIGGTMSLQSARGEGTSLRVELPLDDQEQYPTR